MIDQNSINEVLNKVEILEIAQKLVPGLKKSGTSWKAKSPFTDENTGSFFVVPHKQIYKCFSSGEGGRAVDLVMKMERCTWIEAIKWLADFYKIDLVETTSKDSPEVIHERKNKFESADKILRAAWSNWHKYTTQNDQLDKWLAERKITKDDAIQWGIVIAPDEPRFLSPKIIESNSYAIAKEIGLVNSKEEYVFDTYRDRIIFPIHGKKGAMVGFAGRLIKEDPEKKLGKYINPLDSFIYHKSEVLYGWHFAQNSIRKSGKVYLTEGYIDVIAMHRVGLDNTIAGCGTAVTEQQAQIIGKASKEVVILMDGDAAGLKATKRAIPIFLATGVEVKICTLPNNQDPDDLIKSFMPDFKGKVPKLDEKQIAEIREVLIEKIEEHTKDAIRWTIDQRAGEAMSPKVKAEFNKQIAELIAIMVDEPTRQEYIKAAAKDIALTPRELSKLVETEINRKLQEKLPNAKREAQQDLSFDREIAEQLPEWAAKDVKLLKYQMFLPKNSADRSGDIGMYFPPVRGNAPVFSGLERATNFTLEPLYQIKDERNGRWLLKVRTPYQESYVELPNEAFSERGVMLKLLVPHLCHPFPAFGAFHFNYIQQYVMGNSKPCFELTTLGHQSKEDFFAYSNAVIVKEDSKLVVREYDELGMVTVKKLNFMSPGVSAARIESREENSMYENDLYLKYVESPVSFQQWAEIYNTVFDDHGMYGISFAFLSMYKDMIYKIGAKCPLLYLYGPKGSGKSAMGESLMFLFYSGKNSEGRLIQAVNMSPGMITDFALASALQRFRNCPRLYNEYDPGMTDVKYRGWFKAAFDGEGRERGIGDGGGKRKTEIMKVQGTVMIAGQYMDSGDDGAVMTRSINLQFSEEKNKNRTQEQKDLYMKLQELESKGLAGCLQDLFEIREYVWSKLKDRFYEVKKQMSGDARRRKGTPVEERLLNNYSLCYTFSEIVNEKIRLPYNMLDMYNDCIQRIVDLSSLISDGSVVNKFWDVIEYCIDSKQLTQGKEFDVQHRMDVKIRTSNDTIDRAWPNRKKLLFIRLGSLYAAYAKEIKHRGAKGFEESTIETYLKDQPYYVGSCPRHYFSEGKETSAYVFDMDQMETLGILLQNTYQTPSATKKDDSNKDKTIESVEPAADSSPKPIEEELPF